MTEIKLNHQILFILQQAAGSIHSSPGFDFGKIPVQEYHIWHFLKDAQMKIRIAIGKTPP